VRYRIEGERKEPVLAAYGTREDGKKVLLSIAPGSRESTMAWKSSANDMRSHGLRSPLMAITETTFTLVCASPLAPSLPIANCLFGWNDPKCVPFEQHRPCAAVRGIIEERE
jgi:hypothetical protein